MNSSGEPEEVVVGLDWEEPDCRPKGSKKVYAMENDNISIVTH